MIRLSRPVLQEKNAAGIADGIPIHFLTRVPGQQGPATPDCELGKQFGISWLLP